MNYLIKKSEIEVIKTVTQYLLYTFLKQCIFSFHELTNF